MRIAVPDLISNSYFPALAAIELGFFKAEGFHADLHTIYPLPKAMEALRDHQVDFVAGSAHATLTAFPEWKGAKLKLLLGKTVRLYILVQDADLYGFRFK